MIEIVIPCIVSPAKPSVCRASGCRRTAPLLEIDGNIPGVILVSCGLVLEQLSQAAGYIIAAPVLQGCRHNFIPVGVIRSLCVSGQHIFIAVRGQFLGREDILASRIHRLDGLTAVEHLEIA